MRIGFLVNPIAGMGGRVGLKGTDDVLDEARRRGALPVAPDRALQALRALRERAGAAPVLQEMDWVTCSGEMGEIALRSAGFEPGEPVIRTNRPSSARDTLAAARAFIEAEVDLILFCGGDGTARDIVSVTGDRVPVLGIPAGVKMYSGVFGMTPARSAEIILGFLAGRLSTSSVDVVDLDEQRFRAGEWHVRLYHSALTPYEPTFTPASKAIIESMSDEDAKREIAADLGERIRRQTGTLFLLGPGSTVRSIAMALGLETTLLGIDAVVDCRVIERDLDAGAIGRLVEQYGERHLILSPIGAQGFVLGRGNQQLTPGIIRKIGARNITIVATPAKIARTPVLRFDTGDPALDAELASRGFVTVTIGFHRRRLVRALA